MVRYKGGSTKRALTVDDQAELVDIYRRLQGMHARAQSRVLATLSGHGRRRHGQGRLGGGQRGGAVLELSRKLSVQKKLDERKPTGF